MKSPLSFLSGLVRRRPVEPQQVLIGHQSEAKDIKSEAQQALEPVVIDEPLPSAASSRDENAAHEPVSTAAAIEAEVVASPTVEPELSQPIADAAVAPEIPAAPAKERAKRGPRKTKEAGETIPAVEIVSDKAVAEQVSVPAPSASDEAVILDAEINELRKQLTQKLQLQNAQLKNMLERFGS